MNARLPSAPSEASAEASKATPSKGEVSAEALAEGQTRKIDGDLADLERSVNAQTADEGVDLDETPVGTPPPAPKGSDAPKTGWAGFVSSLSAGWGKISEWFGGAGKKIGDWVKDLMGIKNPPKEAINTDLDLDTGDPIDPDEKIPDDVSGWIKVQSWEQLQSISDLGERIAQAALFAYETNMDCFTKDGNHCSAWCDSVFAKAGLDTVYNNSARIYSNHLSWPKKGTMQGLRLLPGDSIIRYNGNAATGYHQEIILSSEGPDSAGNYKVVTVGQTSVHGSSGTRKIRSLNIKGDDIKVVIRPGATEPWNGGSDLVS